MKRLLYDQLIAWKSSAQRKPLLLQGARQVGKTYLIQHFGSTAYQETIHINFEQDPGLRQLFVGRLDPEKILLNLGFYVGKKITAKDTLIFFDEIQLAPEALTSLKYFYEQAPQYHIIAAGSLLGVSLGKDRNFPVGKVNFMTLYPMNFKEFLIASGDIDLSNLIHSHEFLDHIPEPIHLKLQEALKLYLFLGGMPEVIGLFLETKNAFIARNAQLELLKSYQNDFSKYADPGQVLNTSEVWNSIPSQLARENKKFKYNEIRKNGRSSMFESSITWLKDAGLIFKTLNVRTPLQPLSGYADPSIYKLYLLDTGLLGAMLDVSSDIIIKPDALFQEYNGAFVENFVATELASLGKAHYYWTSKYDAEVDFLISDPNNIYPVEVKSGLSRNLKSLRSYQQQYHANHIFRLSPRPYSRTDDFTNIPLYAVPALRSNDLTEAGKQH